MVTHPLSDITKLVDGLDSESSELGLVTDTGMQEDLRSTNGTAGEDDLFLGRDDATSA